MEYDDRRRYPRRAMMRQASLFVTPKEEVPCIILNISKDGAMLALQEELTLPKRFVLDLSGNIVVRRVCELAWQDGLHAGVKFPVLQAFESVQFDLD
jgi:hypothetical protein